MVSLKFFSRIGAVIKDGEVVDQAVGIEVILQSIRRVPTHGEAYTEWEEVMYGDIPIYAETLCYSSRPST